MEPATIFFSYSRQDANEFAFRLANDLRAYGANIWIDQLDIPPGKNWDEEIEKALGASKYILFIASERSVASQNVLNEVYYAVDEMKVVIPIKMHPCNIPFRIRRFQYIDFTEDYSTGFQRLVKTLNLKEKSEDVKTTGTLQKEDRNQGLAEDSVRRKSVGKDIKGTQSNEHANRMNPDEAGSHRTTGTQHAGKQTRVVPLLILIGLIALTGIIYFIFFSNSFSNNNGVGDSIVDSSVVKRGTIVDPVIDSGYVSGNSRSEGAEESEGRRPLIKGEVKAIYPGGSRAWTAYLNRSLRYPREAQFKRIQGIVTVQFIVEKDGSVSNIQAISGPAHAGLRKEAIRLVQNSGKWKPALQNGISVRSYTKVPVGFRLKV